MPEIVFLRCLRLCRVVLLVVVSLVSGFSSQGVADDFSKFRVMSYNIHHGEGADGRINIERIARVIKEQKADIVALQEVDRGVLRSGRRDLPAELAKLTGMSVFFENNHSFQGGDYGNAVLTRFPILHATNTHYKMLETDEQRGAIQIVLWVDGKRLLLMDTHLNYRPTGETERLLHVGALKDFSKKYGQLSVIVCGDFNAPPDSPTHAEMKKFLNDSWLSAGQGSGFTIPSEKPNARIDYIWTSDSVEPIKIWVPSTLASDHLPVVGEFRLR